MSDNKNKRDNPGNLPRSLWAATADVGDQYPQMSGDNHAQVAVIGGGFLGLSTALHLAERSRDVVLIEANVPGWGASGRNGGQVIPGLKHSPDEIEQMFGAKFGSKIIETIGGAADYLFAIVRKHGIACDTVQAGWIQAAHSQKALAKPLERARQWGVRGADIEVLESRAIADMIGSDAYVGGWIDRRGGSIQPLSFANGLARAARATGARIYSHTAALKISQHRQGWLITTPNGQLFAEQIVIATNGYTGRLWPGLRRTIVPVRSMLVATQPLPEQVLNSILPGGQVVSDTRNMLRYFRIDPSGRLLMGTRGPFRDDVTMADANAHIRAIADLFPQIGDIRLDHVWSGRIAMTPDHMPHIHLLAPGVVTALGFNGRGVALATRLGRAMADLLDDRASEDIGFPVVPMKQIIGHGLSGIAARAMVQYYRLKDSFS